MLGNNNPGVDSWVPVQAIGLTNVAALSNGKDSHMLAITSDGSVWAWGTNDFGELGDGSTTDAWVPIQAGTTGNAVAVAAGGFHSVALMDDSTVWCWF